MPNMPRRRNLPPAPEPMNPLRVLALAVILGAQRDRAWDWLRSEDCAVICAKLDIDHGELLRRTAERAQMRPGTTRHYVAGRT